MLEYLNLVKTLVVDFDPFELEHVPRAKNVGADFLAKLVSTIQGSGEM